MVSLSSDIMTSESLPEVASDTWKDMMLPPGTRWAEECDSDDECERSKECVPASVLPPAMTKAFKVAASVNFTDATNFWTHEDADQDVWDCDVQELKCGKQIVCIGDHKYELGSLTNDKKRALTTEELKNGWTIKAIEVCPEGAQLTEEESARDFQGPGAMRIKAASEAFKCKLSLRGFGAEGDVENGVFVPRPDTAPPVALIAAKNDKPENLLRAIEWVKARVCQIQQGAEDEFEAEIKRVWAAVEASRSESDERLKEAKKEQSSLQKVYVKHLKLPIKEVQGQC